jgi:hypothetical protein
MRRVQPEVVRLDYAKLVEQLAQYGLTESQIEHLGFQLSKHDELRTAFHRGLSNGVLQVSTAVYQRAIGGDLRAAELYLKARGGQHWTSPLLGTANSGPVTLVMLRELYSREIEGRDD